MNTISTPVRAKHQGLSFPLKVEMVERITMDDFNYKTKEGDVVLVRSTGVRHLGDHFVIIVGPLVQKTVGLRPQVIVFEATKLNSWVLDLYETSDREEPILLKLGYKAAASFRDWYEITMTDGHVNIPENKQIM
jgi:hypothetical protein